MKLKIELQKGSNKTVPGNVRAPCVYLGRIDFITHSWL